MGTVLVVINYHKFSTVFEKNMVEKTDSTCRKLSVVLGEATWNLDNVQMKEYFKDYLWELSEMAYITIFTEFEDPIYTIKFSDTTDFHKCRHPIYYNNEMVGIVEVALDQTRQANIKAMILRLWIGSMTSTIIIIFLIALYMLKKLIGAPVKLLMSALSEIESGNIDYRLPEVNSSMEALMISRTVDNMSVEIGKRSRQLKREIEIRKATEKKLKEFNSAYNYLHLFGGYDGDLEINTSKTR